MLASLGLRFSSTDYTYFVLSGSKVSPVVVKHKTVQLPAGYAKPQLLRWLYQEIEDLCKEYDPKNVCIKGAEPMATRGAAFVARTEMEAVTFLLAYNHGIKQTYRKVKATIAKDLGLKGKAKYLKTKLDCSIIPDFQDYSEHQQEALLAAWSQLD